MFGSRISSNGEMTWAQQFWYPHRSIVLLDSLYNFFLDRLNSLTLLRLPLKFQTGVVWFLISKAKPWVPVSQLFLFIFLPWNLWLCLELDSLKFLDRAFPIMYIKNLESV